METALFIQEVTFPGAFVAGLLSFFSPCILPLVPGYFTFLAGTSLDQVVADDQAEVRRRLILATLAFVLGFSLVFVLLGASASLLGGLIDRYRHIFRIGGGIVIIILGVHISGIVRIPWLDAEKRLHLSKKPAHFFGTFLIGMAFAAGWSPCIGPILGSILIVAGSQETVGQGALLLSVYSAGIAIPFLVLAFFAHYLLEFLKRATRVMPYVNAAAGLLLIAIGVILVTDKMAVFDFLTSAG